MLTAGILWFTFNYLSAAPAYNKTLDVPLALRGVAAGLVGSSNVHQVTLELSGPRGQLEGLTPEAFNAFVDCAGKAGTVALNVSVVGPGSEKIIAVKPSQAVVILDRYAYRRVPVITNASGATASMADMDPKTAIVAGGQSKVAQVYGVLVALDLASANKRVVMQLKGVAVDARFTPISGLTVAPANVRVTVVPRKAHA